MSRVQRMGAGLLILALALGGCYGPFRLTRKLHTWNGQVGDKWANEVVFIVLVWVPVYGLATLGDGLIFNSIEFWTGNNPINSAESDRSGIRTKRIVKKDAEARLTRVVKADRNEFVIEQFNAGKPAESLHIQNRDGIMVASNARGKTLYTARTLADGSVVVSDAEGKPVVTHSAEEIQQYKESVK